MKILSVKTNEKMPNWNAVGINARLRVTFRIEGTYFYLFSDFSHIMGLFTGLPTTLGTSSHHEKMA